MIGSDIGKVRQLAEAIADASDFSPLGPKLAALCTELVATVADKRFPGAAVPRLGRDGSLCVYVVAGSIGEWRRLSPVLKAFAGPTFTSFQGLPVPLPQGDPVADVLTAAMPAVTTVIYIPKETTIRLAAMRALVRAQETFSRVPMLQRAAPVPTSCLLSQFQDYLNGGRRGPAAEIMALLKSELRLDALNLQFLEVQFHAAFEDWPAIVGMPTFGNLCQSRKTPAVTNILLDALYHVYLSQFFEAEDSQGIFDRYENDVRPFAHSLLVSPAAIAFSPTRWRVLALEARLAPGRADLIRVSDAHRDALGWIANHIPPAPDNGAGQPQPIDRARSALAQVDVTESVTALAEVVKAISELSPEEIAALRQTGMFRQSLEAAEQTAECGLPTNWTEWLGLASQPRFTNALEIARHGMDEWPIGPETTDPTAVEIFLAALEASQADQLATERTAQALPYLVRWLRRDPEFPRPTMAKIYANLLTLFALGSTRATDTYESSLILVQALLKVGLDLKAYHGLINDVEEIAGSGLGVATAYWALEIVEEFLGAATPDERARRDFLHRMLSLIAPLSKRLSSLQFEAVALLASELDWSLDTMGTSPDKKGGDSLQSQLNGLRIAIYSLSESASRQAKAALEQVAPGVKVECNTDHVGTQKLRALAENAHVFVIVWQAAKHAATNYIRQHRGDRPLTYSKGKGFTSILKAIEEQIQ